MAQSLKKTKLEKNQEKLITMGMNRERLIIMEMSPVKQTLKMNQERRIWMI